MHVDFVIRYSTFGRIRLPTMALNACDPPDPLMPDTSHQLHLEQPDLYFDELHSGVISLWDGFVELAI